MLGREALIVLSQLHWVIAEKRAEPLSQVRGWVNRWMKITVMRSYSQMIRGSRLPSPLREQESDWDTESGIGLADYTTRPSKNTYMAKDASKPPMRPPLPPSRTTSGSTCRNQVSMGFWSKNQGLQHKKVGIGRENRKTGNTPKEKTQRRLKHRE